jgi:hypothetical protein
MWGLRKEWKFSENVDRTGRAQKQIRYKMPVNNISLGNWISGDEDCPPSSFPFISSSSCLYLSLSLIFTWPHLLLVKFFFTFSVSFPTSFSADRAFPPYPAFQFPCLFFLLYTPLVSFGSFVTSFPLFLLLIFSLPYLLLTLLPLFYLFYLIFLRSNIFTSLLMPFLLSVLHYACFSFPTSLPPCSIHDFIPSASFFSFPVQNGSGAHPASYPMGTRGSFSGGKAVGV